MAMTPSKRSLVTNLVLCVLFGLVILVSGIVRGRVVEHVPYREAAEAGLVAGLIVFAISAGFVLAFWGKSDD